MWHKVSHQMRKKQINSWIKSFSSDDYISHTTQRLHAYEWVNTLCFMFLRNLNLHVLIVFFFYQFPMMISWTVIFWSFVLNFKCHVVKPWGFGQNLLSSFTVLLVLQFQGAYCVKPMWSNCNVWGKAALQNPMVGK